MSKTEKTEISDLRRYMEQSLAEHYTQVITFKDREDSYVSLYAHKDSGKKMLLRRSGNRNDGVYRALRGKRLCNLPMVLEVCSEEAHLLVLEEYIEGRTLDKILDSGQLTSAQAAAYTIDLFGGKSWRVKKYYIVFNLSINNLLNVTDFAFGGFEQFRFDPNNIDKFPPKYFYLYGTQYFANLSLRF